MGFGVAFRDGLVLKPPLYFRPNWAKSIPCFLACSSKFQVWRRIANIVPAWWNCNLCRFPLPSEWPKLAFKLDTRIPLMWRPKYIVHAKRAYCRFVFKKISFKWFNFFWLERVTPTHFVASWNRNSSAAVDGDWPKTSNKSPWVVRLAPGWQKLAAFRQRQKWPWKARIY